MRNLTLSAAGAVALLLATGTADAAPQNNHRLDASFARADKNKDGFLDAAELAREFRGPNAKPIAERPGAKEVHPDHAFLDAYDTDQDGRISKAEFERYEQKVLAGLRSTNNRNRNYSRAGRTGYRAPLRHRGSSGAVYGTNPYLNQVRYVQRVYQQQRQAYTNAVRYGVYSPSVRGSYRGAMTHSRHGGRR